MKIGYYLCLTLIVSTTIPTQSAAKALKHFNYRLPLAEGFLISAGECLYKEQYGVCVFMFHQVVE